MKTSNLMIGGWLNVLLFCGLRLWSADPTGTAEKVLLDVTLVRLRWRQKGLSYRHKIEQYAMVRARKLKYRRPSETAIDRKTRQLVGWCCQCSMVCSNPIKVICPQLHLLFTDNLRNNNQNQHDWCYLVYGSSAGCISYRPNILRALFLGIN